MKTIFRYSAAKIIHWYDRIAALYDPVTEWFYRPMRRDLLEAMALKAGDRVLVIACGTGQNFDLLEEKIGAEGEIVAVDYSQAMLERARRRVEKHGWKNIRLLRADARRIDREYLETLRIDPLFDAVDAELAFTVIPAWKKVMENSTDLLKPGGKLGILDWYRPKNDVLTRLVNFLARAETTRDVAGYARKLLGNFTVVKTYFFGNVFIGVGKNESKI